MWHLDVGEGIKVFCPRYSLGWRIHSLVDIQLRKTKSHLLDEKGRAEVRASVESEAPGLPLSPGELDVQVARGAHGWGSPGQSHWSLVCNTNVITLICHTALTLNVSDSNWKNLQIYTRFLQSSQWFGCCVSEIMKSAQVLLCHRSCPNWLVPAECRWSQPLTASVCVLLEPEYNSWAGVTWAANACK